MFSLFILFFQLLTFQQVLCQQDENDDLLSFLFPNDFGETNEYLQYKFRRAFGDTRRRHWETKCPNFYKDKNSLHYILQNQRLQKEANNELPESIIENQFDERSQDYHHNEDNDPEILEKRYMIRYFTKYCNPFSPCVGWKGRHRWQSCICPGATQCRVFNKGSSMGSRCS